MESSSYSSSWSGSASHSATASIHPISFSRTYFSHRGWASLYFYLLVILLGLSADGGPHGGIGALAAPAPQFVTLQPPATSITPVINPTPPVVVPGQGGNNPSACARVGAEAEAMRAMNPNAVPTVAAQLAFDCLQSVPNKPEPAQALVRSLQAYTQWQSTLPWLKNPPASYMLPPTDVPEGLADIGRTSAARGYASEYEFQLAILQLFASAHDGHFNYRGDVFKAFAFGNALAADIVSVSRDGREVPRLYHSRMLSNNSASLPPAITMINGQDATTLIQDLNLQFSGFQDPDSQWNSVFPNYASPEAALTVAGSIAFQGPSLTLTYDNGQERTQESFAIIRASADFTGVQNGEDFYNRFCNPELNPVRTMPVGDVQPQMPDAPPGVAPAPVFGPGLAPPRPGYPAPVVRDSGSNTTSGYFLQGVGHDDVAVLSVSSFAPDGNLGPVEYLGDFQRTVETFLSQCRDQNKQRLVIDLSANGGGFVIAGFDLFAQLFPDAPRFQATNLRLAESLVGIAQGLDELPLDQQPANDLERNAIIQLATSALIGNFIPGEVFKPSGEDFQSIQSILAPVTLNGDDFSAYQQSPLTQPNLDFNLTGVGSRARPPPAVFAPENVVLLTDGTCGSTCTLFAYFATLGLGVKTAVMGGRPQPGPMQAIAGVEGAQVFFFNDMQADAAAILALSPPEKRRELERGEMGELARGYAIARARDQDLAGAVNGKNAFMPSDAKTPLQFLFQPANCRFYYTPQMVGSAEAAWRMAVDATWTNPAGLCVEGSRTAPNGTTQGGGNIDPAFTATDPGMLDNVNVGGTTPPSGNGEGQRVDQPEQSGAARRNSMPVAVLAWTLAATVFIH